MKSFVKPEIIISTVAAGMILGALVIYGRQIPVIGEQVAKLAAVAK